MVQVIEENNLQFSPYNFSQLFLRQHEAHMSVCIRTLVDELETRRWRIKMSIRLMEYDSDADGYLTLSEVQQWLSDFAGMIVQWLESHDALTFSLPSLHYQKWIVLIAGLSSKIILAVA
jgi:hypothetical protein